MPVQERAAKGLHEVQDPVLELLVRAAVAVHQQGGGHLDHGLVLDGQHQQAGPRKRQLGVGAERIETPVRAGASRHPHMVTACGAPDNAGTQTRDSSARRSAPPAPARKATDRASWRRAGRSPVPDWRRPRGEAKSGDPLRYPSGSRRGRRPGSPGRRSLRRLSPPIRAGRIRTLAIQRLHQATPHYVSHPGVEDSRVVQVRRHIKSPSSAGGTAGPARRGRRTRRSASSASTRQPSTVGLRSPPSDFLREVADAVAVDPRQVVDADTTRESRRTQAPEAPRSG